MITISIVSHMQMSLIEKLIQQIIDYKEISSIILTHNTLNEDKLKLNSKNKVVEIFNNSPIGFAKNHNNAFNYCKTKYFCVLNPDIEFNDNLFHKLIVEMKNNNLSLISPLIVNKSSGEEDSCRDFPSILNLLKKNFMSIKPKILSINEIIYSEWIGGMFMLFRSDHYMKINGFDDKFRLYCEDVDLCIRIKKNKLKFGTYKKKFVIHDARRNSRKNLKFLYYHFKSLIRLYFKYPNKIFF